MKLGSALAAALAALLLIIACGGGDDDDAPSDDDGGDATPALTENDLAESMLLTRANLPGNWTYSPPDEAEEQNPLDECDPGDPPGLTGKADGGEFSLGDTDTITEDVRIFEDAEALVASLDDISDRADCMEQVVNDGGLDTEDAKYSDFTFEENDGFPSFSDETRAYQIKIHIEATDADGNQQEGDFYIDLVFVAIDNVGFQISASDVFDPYPPAGIAEIVEIAEGKILSILGGGDDDDDDRATPTPKDREDETERPDETDAPSSGAGSSQDDPVPFGESGVLIGRAEVRVLEVEFDAEEVVLAESSDNEATPGKNMVLVKVEVTNVGDEDLNVFFDLFYNLIGDKGTPYDEFSPSCGTAPDEIEGALETGESTEGNICVQADEDDSNLVFFLEMFNDDIEEEELYLALE